VETMRNQLEEFSIMKIKENKKKKDMLEMIENVF
jgi:hypothetical protein